MFWYIVIGLLAVVAIAILVIYVPERDWPNKRWASFSFFTILLFVFLSKSYWKVPKPRKFWGILFAIFIAHVVLYTPFLQYIQRPLWYIIIMSLEAMLIVLILKLSLNIMPDPRG